MNRPLTPSQEYEANERQPLPPIDAPTYTLSTHTALHTLIGGQRIGLTFPELVAAVNERLALYRPAATLREQLKTGRGVLALRFGPDTFALITED